MAPGGDLFSSMGHTALVVSGGGREHPVSYDWGAFDATQPGLLPTFLSGELEYFLHRSSLASLTATVRAGDRQAVAQRIEAPPPRIEALTRELDQAASPEHRNYTYHWGTANCATKARDVLDALLAGQLTQATSPMAPTTARFEGDRHLHRWPILAFAWRFLVSARLDAPLSRWERTMIPEHLMREVEPFASERCTLHEGRYPFAPPAPPNPWMWTLPGAAGALCIVVAARRAARRTVGALAVLYALVLCGLGLPSLALWAVSRLEGIGPTENWLVAGPQSLVVLFAGIQALRQRLGNRLGWAALVVAGIGMLAIPLKVLPGFTQANGDILAALLPGLVGTCVALFWIRTADGPPPPP